jgi:SET domain
VEPRIVSAINHSCSPNAAVTMDGTRVIVTALLPIPRGKEIFISYINTQDSRASRIRLLFRRYGFTCACPKCVAEKDGDVDSMLPWHTDMSVGHAERFLKHVKVHGAPHHPSGQPPAPPSSPEAATAKKERDARAVAVGTAFVNYLLLAKTLDEASDEGPLLADGLAFCAAQGLEGTTAYWAVRDSLVLWNINRGDFRRAFLLDARQYFERLPARFPAPHEPERVRMSFRFYKLLDAFVGDIPAGERSRLPFDPPLCLYGVARGVADAVGKSHGDDTRFASEVRGVFEELKARLQSGGPVRWGLVDRKVPLELEKLRRYAEENI